jgi:hypothetical protein
MGIPLPVFGGMVNGLPSSMPKTVVSILDAFALAIEGSTEAGFAVTVPVPAACCGTGFLTQA